MFWARRPIPMRSLMYIMHWCWDIDSRILRFCSMRHSWNKPVCVGVDVHFSQSNLTGSIKSRTVVRTWQCNVRSTRCPIDVCFCRNILLNREKKGNLIIFIYFNFQCRKIKEMNKLCTKKEHANWIYTARKFSKMKVW